MTIETLIIRNLNYNLTGVYFAPLITFELIANLTINNIRIYNNSASFNLQSMLIFDVNASIGAVEFYDN